MIEDTGSMRDVYEMMTYIVVIIVSAVIMTMWLKRRSKRKKNK